VGESAWEWRAERECCQRAQKEDDVSRRSEENCRCPKVEMGEGKGCSKEVGLKAL
jgi:hypothetical protein